MSELPQNIFEDMSAEVTAVPQLPHFSVGGALRDARIQSGMSVNEVSSRIKFAPRQIEALEADDFLFRVAGIVADGAGEVLVVLEPRAQ